MTETTTQPDPQVVAWMREWLRRNPGSDAAQVLLAYARHGVLPLADDTDVLVASARAARKPLTRADIPAGQGTASLFIGPGLAAFASAPHHRELMYMRADGLVEVLDLPGPEWEGSAALRGHLAATLPTVTDATEEADLSPLFDTPQIHTDTDGQHRDETGREYTAVDVDGEITYQPTVDTTEEST